MRNEKMKKTIKRVVAVVAFLALLVLCTCYIMRTVKDKNNYYKYVSFYEEEESFDVLFFGSSRILDAVYPMELWNEYGITSYNMAQHSEGIKTSYWQMKNAFAHNAPKVAVVDLSLLNLDVITDENEDMKSYLHKSLDHMPFSKIKYEALVDLTEGVDLWEYLFPYAMYHNRWNQLEKVDFYLEWPCRKGAESRVDVYAMEKVEWCTEDVAKEVDTESLYIDKIIRLCEEYDVQPVFTLMPTVLVSADYDSCTRMNALACYFEEKGIPFVNFAKEDGMINYEVDFHDISHLNPSGGKKLTKALGEILVEEFEFPQKSEKTIAAWNEADYMGAKLGELISEQNSGDLLHYLLLLNDDDYTFEIKIPEAGYLEGLGVEAMLEELGVTEEDCIIDAAIEGVEITVYRCDWESVFHVAKFQIHS